MAGLLHRRRVQDDARRAAGDKRQDSDLVFTTKWGTPIEPRIFNPSFELYARKAGPPTHPRPRPRHTCASMPAALGVHPRVAMRVLRHSRISVTVNVYTQIASPETPKALDQLNDSLDSKNP
ncbi:tyrosine-type recombinase/integrase [Nonomuraea muscovyensis]|uniref:tyrosine-type recombinase/integrase n=1 Tax=Nonomuraea muscovyensis TaxID=1124761 RepID=UPI0033D1CB23